MTRCVGIRGATTVDSDDLDEILDATQDLLSRLAELNQLDPDDLASILFTVTPDLRATFPARAARRLGWTQVPMLCAQEIDAPQAVQRCVRVMMHWNTERSLSEVRHAYLRGSRILRPDWALPPLGGDAGTVTAPERPWLEGADPRPPAPAAAPVVAAEPAPIDVLPIAILGEPGSYSQEAVFRALGEETPTVSGASFRAVADALHTGRAKSAVLPVENSTTGSIHPVFDLLLSQDLRIVGELILPVHHVLLAPPGMTLADVTTVTSHPQALRQCDGWIDNHRWARRGHSDTAGAAKTVAATREPGLAAIASRVAAARYGLQILAEDIQDVSENYTRFALLVPAHSAPERVAVAGLGDGGDRPLKTSLIFSTRHVSGDLYACLAEFAMREINLTKIESRPDRRTAWHYLFYLDFEGDPADLPVAQALAGLRRHATFLRVLGTYPSRSLDH